MRYRLYIENGFYKSYDVPEGKLPLEYIAYLEGYNSIEHMAEEHFVQIYDIVALSDDAYR